MAHGGAQGHARSAERRALEAVASECAARAAAELRAVQRAFSVGRWRAAIATARDRRAASDRLLTSGAQRILLSLQRIGRSTTSAALRRWRAVVGSRRVAAERLARSPDAWVSTALDAMARWQHAVHARARATPRARRRSVARTGSRAVAVARFRAAVAVAAALQRWLRLSRAPPLPRDAADDGDPAAPRRVAALACAAAHTRASERTIALGEARETSASRALAARARARVPPRRRSAAAAAPPTGAPPRAPSRPMRARRRAPRSATQRQALRARAALGSSWARDAPRVVRVGLRRARERGGPPRGRARGRAHRFAHRARAAACVVVTARARGFVRGRWKQGAPPDAARLGRPSARRPRAPRRRRARRQ